MRCSRHLDANVAEYLGEVQATSRRERLGMADVEVGLDGCKFRVADVVVPDDGSAAMEGATEAFARAEEESRDESRPLRRAGDGVAPATSSLGR